MVALNPTAVTSAGLLRAIASGDHATNADLARAAGRDPRNITRDLAILAAAGLVAVERNCPATLTREGREQLDALARAEGDERGSSSDPSALLLHLDQILPDPDNARADWDSDAAVADLAAMARSIADHGLLQPVVVRALDDDDLQPASVNITGPDGTVRQAPAYRLVAGERRWRAIGLAIANADLPGDYLIRATLRGDAEDATSNRIAAITENYVRRDLNPLEKARAFEQLAELSLDNRDIADVLGCTPEHIQQHRRLLKLDAADQQRLTLPPDDPRALTFTAARKKQAVMAHEEKAREMAESVLADLTPAERLTLIECLVAARNNSSWRGTPFPVAADARKDAIAIALSSRQCLTFGDRPVEDRGHRGGYTCAIAAGDAMVAALLLAHPDLDSHDRDRRVYALGLLQDELSGVQEPYLYITPWLNGPFEITPEGQAVIDEQAQLDAAREARENRAAQAAAERSRIIAAARERHLDLLNRAARDEDRPEELRSLTRDTAAALDAVLPWTLVDNGHVYDATGALVRAITVRSPDEIELGLLQVVVLATNNVGNHACPPLQPATDFLPALEAVAAWSAAIEDLRTNAAESTGDAHPFNPGEAA